MEFVAYRMKRLLGMDYVPPVAYRRNIEAAFQNWSEGAIIYAVPDAHLLGEVGVDQWGVAQELLLSDARILDALMINSDRAWGNFLRGKHWVTGEYSPALIDNAAGLRPSADVQLTMDNAFQTGGVQVVREKTLQRLRGLTAADLDREFGEYVSQAEIWQMLGRRDGIVGYFDELIAERGYDAVVRKVDDFPN